MQQLSIIYWNLPKNATWTIDAPHISNEKCIWCPLYVQCVTIYLDAFVNKLSIAHFKLYSKYNCSLFDSIQGPFIDTFHSKFISKRVHWYDINTEILFIHIWSAVFLSILLIVSMLRKAGRQVERDCGKSNGKNVLNKNYRTERADNWKEWNECRCFFYCCWLFYNIISTMDYLCKLIESNKNTSIVNRCLPLNYREISWMHSSSIWALEQNVKCRRKK